MLFSGTINFPGSDLRSDKEIIITDSSGFPVDAGKHYEILEDKNKSLTISEITTAKYSTIFRPLGLEKPNFGYSNSAFWIRVDLKNISKTEKNLYLEIPFPTLDSVSFYLVDQNPFNQGKILEQYISGDTYQFSRRPVSDRNFVFAFNAPAGGVLSIYLRIVSQGSLTVGSQIWDTAAFYQNSRHRYIALSMYFGILLALFFYNFLLFISLRDRIYLLYVIFVICMALGQGAWSGLFFEYLWPNWPALGNLAAVFGFNATGLFGALFSRSFLNTKKSSPVLDKLLLLFASLFLLWALGVSFIPYGINSILTSFTGVGFSITAVIAGVLVAIKGFKAARIFLIAWTMLLLGTASLGARNLNILPTNFFTTYSMLYGSALEMILLSFALAERIKLVNREKEDMKTEALQHKQMFKKGLSQLSLLRDKSRAFDKELSMARDIQMTMVPLKSPCDNIRSLYLPMEKVGGDFFDIIVLDERRIGVFISDVSGHGIPAALITVMIKSMILVGINELHSEEGTSWLMEPDKFIIHMNNSLFGHLRDNFTTAFYGVYDNVDKSFKYSSAAHPPPILLNYGDHDEITLGFLNVSPQAPPFGVFHLNKENAHFGINRIILPKKSRLLLYSDGLMDNVDYDFLNSEKGLDSFKNTILYDFFRESTGLNLQSFLETLSIQLLLHKDMGLVDDVCAVVLENDFN